MMAIYIIVVMTVEKCKIKFLLPGPSLISSPSLQSKHC